MTFVKIINQRSNEIIGSQIVYANTYYKRFIGLIGKNELNSNEGLFLTPCNSIHMMFMKFPIDLIFLDRKNKIVHITENIKPWQISRIVFRGQSVLEVAAGKVKETESKVGDRILIEF